MAVAFGAFGRSLAAVVAAATFTMWAGPAAQADGEGPRAVWSAGPDVQIADPGVVRLSADRFLAFRVGPRSCVSGVQGCAVPVYDPLAAVVIDTRTGRSTPVLGPPADMKLQLSPVSVDGDAYFPLVDPKNPSGGGSDPSALARYIGAEDRWERIPIPPGLSPGFGLAVAGRRLVALETGRPDTAGMVLEADGVWRALPANPLWDVKNRGGGDFVAAGRILVVRQLPLTATTPKDCLPRSACPSETFSLSINGGGRPAAGWQRLPDVGYPVSYTGAIIGHNLTTPDVTYDLETGRTQLIHADRRPGEVQIVREGTVLGHWFTIGNRLFDPESRRWIPIPTPPSGSPSYDSTYPDGPTGERIDNKGCSPIGGADNILLLCNPPEHVNGGTAFGTIDRRGQGKTEVLRVIDAPKESTQR